MGYASALEMATSGIDIDTTLGWHLQSNHYPPIPLSMLQPCKDAIDAYWDDDCDLEIELPEPILYKGRTTAPAWAIIEQHHLHAWTTDYDFDAEDYND